MHTKYTNNTNKIIYPELSYLITGIFFDIHNLLGRYAKEKQYSDEIEKKLKEKGINHKREFAIKDSGNILDFIVEDKMILEIKAKPVITKDDYYQTQRYLQDTDLKLGLLINFRNKYLKPLRIVKIDRK